MTDNTFVTDDTQNTPVIPTTDSSGGGVVAAQSSQNTNQQQNQTADMPPFSYDHFTLWDDNNPIASDSAWAVVEQPSTADTGAMPSLDSLDLNMLEDDMTAGQPVMDASMGSDVTMSDATVENVDSVMSPSLDANDLTMPWDPLPPTDQPVVEQQQIWSMEEVWAMPSLDSLDADSISEPVVSEVSQEPPVVEQVQENVVPVTESVDLPTIESLDQPSVSQEPAPVQVDSPVESELSFDSVVPEENVQEPVVQETPVVDDSTFVSQAASEEEPVTESVSLEVEDAVDTGTAVSDVVVPSAGAVATDSPVVELYQQTYNHVVSLFDELGKNHSETCTLVGMHTDSLSVDYVFALHEETEDLFSVTKQTVKNDEVQPSVVLSFDYNDDGLLLAKIDGGVAFTQGDSGKAEQFVMDKLNKFSVLLESNVKKAKKERKRAEQEKAERAKLANKLRDF